MAEYSSKEYTVSWLSELLHSFPHVTLTFQHVNSTFSPEDPLYREALYFWACVPVLCLVVTLLALIVFFGYRCCCSGDDVDDKRIKKTVSCYRWTISVLALFTCAVLGVAFFGNQEAYKGTQQFATSLDEVDSTLGNIRSEINVLRLSVNKTIRDANEFENLVENAKRNKLNDSVKADLSRLSNNAKNKARSILRDITNIDGQTHTLKLTSASSVIRDISFYRWITTIAVLCWMVIVCLILLIGVGMASKCLLMLCAGLIVITLVLGWSTSGAYLGAAVGIGDFCISPSSLVTRLAKTRDNPTDVSKDMLNYYVTCGRNTKNPFNVDLRDAFYAVTSANVTLNEAFKLSNRGIRRSRIHSWNEKTRRHLEEAQFRVQQLIALVNCRGLHGNYLAAVKAACYTTQPGVVFILLGVTVGCLLFTTLIFLTAFAWRYFGKRRGYLEIDEDDPFMPRADNTSPSYYRYGSRGSLTGTRPNPTAPNSDHIPMHRRSLPPPTDPLYHILDPNYNASEYYRQYNDMGSGMEDGPTSASNSQA